jgi:hypothetical protein
MSRLTGADALGLYEAYQAVYNPQELTEEQVWEEVEIWVNSLIEEGYDLSDYTWEEMYESYLSEASDLDMGLGRNVLRNRNSPKPKPQMANLGAGYKSAELQQSAKASASQVGTTRTGAGGVSVGGGNAGASVQPAIPKVKYPVAGTPPTKTNTPKGPVLSKLDGVEGTGVGKDFKPRAFTDAEKSRYSSAATQNAARSSTPAAPAAPKPATGVLGKTSFERRTPTSAELKAAQAAKAGGASPEKALQAAQKTNLPTQGNPSAKIDTKSVEAAKAAFKPTPTPKPVATPTPKPVATPTPKPVATPVVKRDPNLGLNPRERMRLQSFDLFDLVKGHLLDEGYADTEEAALAIMINMSEEWRQSIVEERAPGVKPYKAGPTQAEVRADAKNAAKKKAEAGKDTPGYGPEEKFKSDWKLRAVPSSTSKRKGGDVETVSQRMDREAPYKTRPFSPLFTKQGSRTASAVTRATEGPGEPQSVTMPRKKSKPSREIVRKNKDTNESYDYILSHLIYEGYANTVESAEKIISNMSEDWILSIIQ